MAAASAFRSQPRLILRQALEHVLEPTQRRRLAGLLLVASLVGWPLSAAWFARDEPPFVLGLSWLAIALTALDVLATTDVRRKQQEAE